MAAKKKKILFLCTGNSIRSQMAEGYFRSMAGENFEVQSAGVSPASIHPMTIQVMREDGVDISGQWAKLVNDISLKSLARVVTLCGHAKEVCPVIPEGVEQEHWPIEDPVSAVGTPEERLQKFREARDEIRQRVKGLVEKLGN